MATRPFLYVLLLCFNAWGSAASRDCPRPRLLPLGRLGVKCVASSSVSGSGSVYSNYGSGSGSGQFPCEKALDGSPNTMWLPDLANLQHGDRPYIEVRMEQKVRLTRIDMLQADIGQGTAQKIRLTFDQSQSRSQTIRFRRPSSPNEKWNFVSFPRPVNMRSIRLRVDSVHGLVFGGLKELRFYGCYDATRRNGFSGSGNDYETNEALVSQSSMAIGSVLGLCVGGLLALALAFVVCYVLVIVRRRKARANQEQDLELDDDSLDQSQALSDDLIREAIEAELAAEDDEDEKPMT